MSDLIIYNTDDGKSNVALLVENNEVWPTQNQLAEFFDTSVQNISEHIKNILKDNELDENSVIKDYLITAQDGKQYQVKHYALPMNNTDNFINYAKLPNSNKPIWKIDNFWSNGKSNSLKVKNNECL